jgi:hypothetical protein
MRQGDTKERKDRKKTSKRGMGARNRQGVMRGRE